MDVAAVPLGLFRVQLMPEAARYGSIRSASRFIQYCSFPVVTYGLKSWVDGLRKRNGMVSAAFPCFLHAMRRPRGRCKIFLPGA